MSIFEIIDCCDPDDLITALTEDRNIMKERIGHMTPYPYATSTLSSAVKTLNEEHEKPVKNAKKINFLTTQIAGLRQIITILRDVTLQDAIDHADLPALEAMAEIDGMIRSDFETGELKGKSPMQYAREQRKTSVINWFNQRSERVMEYFTACPGTLFDARVRDLDYQHAQETRAAAQRAHSGLVDIAKAAGTSSTVSRL